MQTLKNDTRQKILHSALGAFAHQGFAKVSMRSIAMQAGVGVGNLYNYFPSKDNLFRTVLSPVVTAFYALLNRHHGYYSDAMDMMGEGYLRSTVQEYVNLIRGHRTLMRVLLFGAQGSTLERFKMDFTDKATEQVKLWFEGNKARHPQMNIEVSDFMIHLHTVWMFTLLEEILMHRVSDTEIQHLVEEYVRFEICGWKQILQIQQEA